MEGLVENCDGSAYRRGVDELAEWCENNNLQLNTSKTEEIIFYFRKKKNPVDPLTINGAVIDTVDCFKFLGTTISNTRPGCQCRCEKAQQRLFFLRQLKKFGLRREILIQFYNSVVESVLTLPVCVERQHDSVTKRLAGESHQNCRQDHWLRAVLSGIHL